MKKIILNLLLITVTLFASGNLKNLEVEYDVSYGLFGSVGSAESTLEVDNGTYKLKVVAKAKGVAKLLSGSRQEVYESTGEVVDGKLIPNLFIKKRSTSSATDVKRYFFDHQNKKISLIHTSSKDAQEETDKSELSYYTNDDILTLFFNLKYHIGDEYNTDGKKIFYAVGANENDGRVDIYTPQGKEHKEIKRLLRKKGNIIVATINQKIFSSKKGELYINIDENGVCTKAILKDVALFGDIRGIAKKIKIEE